MVTTFEVKPAVALRPFISKYALRTFNTGKSILPFPMHGVAEYYLSLFLNERYTMMKFETGEKVRFSNAISGFLSRNLGCTYYKGNYQILCVQIKANGLYCLLGIPQRLVQNAVIDLGDLLGRESNRLTEQCQQCHNVGEMATILDAFFLKQLSSRKHKPVTEVICRLANDLFSKNGMVKIDDLVATSNMSARTFERHFCEQIGMPPKLFARVTRFYRAVEDKMFHPGKSWSDITYQYNYYDQSHFIKDVIYFSGKSPEELFKTTPPPAEKYISIAG